MSKAALITSITNAITTNGVGGITGAVLRAQLISIVEETYPADASSFKTINSETITGVGDIVITKSSLGLSNVDNTSDANKPVSTLQAAADAAVLATAQSYADSLVVGLLDDRGNYNASTNLFPTTGGSGTAGAIKKGDLFTISVAGTLGGNAVTAGDVIRALSDTPGQTAANWAITENNLGYIPLNSASNLSDVVSASLARSNLGLGSLATLSTATPTTGGTGLTSYTTGDLIYSSATNVLSKLAAGTNGHVLTLSGGVPTWAAAASGGSTLSSITAATTNATINSAANAIEWQWNSLAGGSGLILSSTSTAAASNTQTLFSVALSGSNSNSSQSTYAAQFSNTHTGTSSTNYALKLSASGATNNYGLTSDADLLVNGITVGKGKWQGTNSSFNTAFGLNALGSAGSGCIQNAAFGRDALGTITGSINNTAVGCGAMGSATSYANCVGVGFYALNVSAGYNNTAVGSAALTNQTSGVRNTAMGSNTGERLTTGSDNVFIGASIFITGSNRGVSENTLVGSSVGVSLTASTTTAFGFKSLYTKTSGANCVAIGYKAGYDVTTAANSVYIGNSLATSHATKDNIILLSDGSGNERVMIESDGRVGIGTTSPDASAILDLTSTTRGFLMPRAATTQITAISSPATGLQLYHTNQNQLATYNGTNWTGGLNISSAGTLTLTYGTDFIFSGTTTTWTLPAIVAGIAGNQNAIYIKNRGSGAITLNTNGGSSVLYTTALVNTLTINAGEGVTIIPDGTYLNVI